MTSSEIEKAQHESIKCFALGIISEDDIFTVLVFNDEDDHDRESYLLMEQDKNILSTRPDEALFNLKHHHRPH